MQSERDYLSAGVGPGGLYSREEIRVLLCDLARQLAQPLALAVAEDVFAAEGLANYFEFRAAVQELLREGKLELRQAQGEAQLVLPPAYTHAVGVLAEELPRRVRDRALHAAEQTQERRRRERDSRISLYPTDDGGCYMTFRQGEGSGLLLSVTVYAPDTAEAERLRDRFLENPGRLFGAVVHAFL
ncbi:MAG: DUF4364 family protein [Oscillospiraceae bacterium]|jgi:hypothetical protein|nr:DUF4364 family protein [Oscillospiraceae bacterium]